MLNESEDTSFDMEIDEFIREIFKPRGPQEKLTGPELKHAYRGNMELYCNPRNNEIDMEADDFFNGLISKNTNQTLRNPEVKQVYTTPKTFHDLNTMFECKNKEARENNEEPDKPCVCPNCAVIGVINDSQKRPFATEYMYDPRNPKDSPFRRDNKMRRKVNFREDSHSHSNCHYYFKELANKVTNLERRIKVQEETAIRKDYFKMIISKLLTHSANCSNASPPIKTNHKCTDQLKCHLRGKYNVHPTLIDERSPQCQRLEDFFKSLGREYDDDSSITVSYMNPTNWDESETSINYRNSERCLTAEIQKEELQDLHAEFLKMIANTSKKDREKLWEIISQYCRANNQSKNDKAIIQFPQKKAPDSQKIEVEYTIEQLKQFLIG